MSTPASPAALPRTGRIIHGVILAGVLIVLGAALFLRAVAAPALPEPAGLWRLIGIGLAAGVTGAARVLRRRVRPREPAAHELAWWQAHMTPAVILWGLCEGLGLAGAAFWYLSGDALVGLGLGGLSVALLLLWSPRRLQEG
jgi:hypothetical protein